MYILCLLYHNNNKARPDSKMAYSTNHRDGICVLDDSSVCRGLRIVEQHLLLESLAMFRSAKANACVERELDV